MLVVASGASSVSSVEQAVIDALWGTPGFLDVVWQLAIVALGVWVAVVAVAALAFRRGAPLADMACGSLVGLGLWIPVHELAGPLAGGTDVPLLFSVTSAALASARPHLGHPFRRVGRYLVVTVAAVLVLVEQATPSGSLLAVLIGVVAAGATHLALGTPEGRPDVSAVEDALRSFGLSVGSVSPTEDQRAGVVTLRSEERTAGGVHPLAVRVYGRDARDTQLLVKLARSLWYRERRGVLPTRIQQAEHEAFVTMLAGSRGASVPAVRAVGRTVSGDAFAAFGDVGEPIETVGRIGPGELAGVWHQVGLVHDAGLALRDVASARYSSQPSSQVGLRDLSTAGLATDDDVLTDRAQLIVLTSQWVGAAAALDAALDHLGEQDFAAVVPYLQAAALGPELRQQLQRSTEDVEVDELRARAASLAGIESPRIAQLRRVSAGSLVQMALMTIAAYAVISLLGGVDVDELVHTLAGASWPWVAAALVVGQLPVVSETLSTQGASVRRLALGPLVALQLAIAFVKLAIPSSAARMGMVLRYFQKQGVPGPTALSISAIETFTGFVVQLALLGVVLGLGSVEMNLPEGEASRSGDLLWLLLVALGVGIAVAACAAAVPALRHRLVDRFRPWIGDARSALDALRSPMRLVQLVGGNLTTQILYAVALAACVAAFGAEIDLGAALAVYVVAALFGGFMPVPGGIGVMEAAITVGLVAVGIGESVALAAAITFRIVTFYVPPLWGWFAFRWLEKNSYL
jgi:uncharacterized membrane protein YbhN (UPF0104 family)